MHIAILEALKNSWNGNIPVGAVLVANNHIIKIFNNKGKFQHAEIFIVNFIYKNNLKNIDIYITMEPCIMCWFLLNNIKKYINQIIFGSWNLKYGAITHDIKWHQKKYIPYIGGIDKDINDFILKSYFSNKRHS
jgi:tRNA(Arg) A34 adenosine deaminase TadA